MLNSVSIHTFAQYIFLSMPLDARKYDLSEKVNHKQRKENQVLSARNLITQKCLLLKGIYNFHTLSPGSTKL